MREVYLNGVKVGSALENSNRNVKMELSIKFLVEDLEESQFIFILLNFKL